jgi:hypothetical protein
VGLDNDGDQINLFVVVNDICTHQTCHCEGIYIAAWCRSLDIASHQFGTHIPCCSLSVSRCGGPECMLVVDGTDTEIAEIRASPIINQNVFLKKD